MSNTKNSIAEKIKNHPVIQKISPYVDDETYIVGGFLRDILFNKDSSDIDLAVKSCTAEKLAKYIADRIPGYFVTLDKINHIYRVVFENKKDYVDIAGIEGENIYEDLARRDFSMNALALNIKSMQLTDPYGGVESIKNKEINAISEKNMLDDPVRLLRAFRFQSTLGFTMEKNLKQITEKHAGLLKQTAAERINNELVKLFSGKFCVDTLKDMDRCGMLELIFPEVKEIKKIPPNSHHHLCLLEHCYAVVNYVQDFYENGNNEIKAHFNEIIFGANPRIAYLKLAAFLHDIGKPATWEIEEGTGRHRFIKHDDVGAKIVEKPLRDLKFSNKQISYIQKIIKYHLYPANVAMIEENNEKAVMRFFRKIGDEVTDLIAIAYGDRLAARGEAITDEMVEHNINGLKHLMKKYMDTKNNLSPLEKLLDGYEIMKILEIKPSAKLGEIVDALKEAQMASEVVTKEEAVEFVKKFKNMKNK